MRTLINEVVADLDDGTSEIVLVIHWVGGVHAELRLPKRRRGQRNATPDDIVDAVRQLVLIANDDLIAGILNRNGLTTGNGNRWTRERVTALRSYRKIPVFRPQIEGWSHGLIWVALRSYSVLRQRPCVWQSRQASLKVFILCRMVRGYSVVQNSRQRKHVKSSIVPGRTIDTPQDRIQISKTYSLQQHRKMGVMKQDCTTNSIHIPRSRLLPLASSSGLNQTSRLVR